MMFSQVSLEDGTVQGFDVRAAKSDATSQLKPSFTLHAHDKAVCTVSYNPSAPNVRNYHSPPPPLISWSDLLRY